LLSGTTIFDEPHHVALEALAAKALAENDASRAFELSDRRCRIDPTPQPHCYLLRAEASFRQGQTAWAIEDLETVLETSPDDLEANRRMLAWSRGRRQRAAARSLLKNDRNPEVLRRALAALNDEDDKAHASISVLDERIEGWVAWHQGSIVEVTIRSGSDVISSFVEPDPFHVLSSERIQAAKFVLTRPRSSEPQFASVTIEGSICGSVRMPGNEPSSHPAKPHLLREGHDEVTIIVPIYADFKATRACVESLLKAIRQSPTTRVVLVNDATPEPEINRYLARLTNRPGVTLVTNARNLGFVGSINRALRDAPRGDVILLNSDTIVPPGFGDRLRAAAYSAPDIGTVNPLSNNGEFSSFPIPNQVNDLGSLKDVIALDALASDANRDRVVDLPSGIGFCLYITRACLDAIGLLSERYQRGYLEDVDFCLRARETGFRSVCAPSVYVGHVGSRSFKSEKRSLVVRNLEVLDRKFPSYRHECSAFAIADPLRPAREAIERRAPHADRKARLIVTGDGAVGEVACGRADDLISSGQDTIILEIRKTPSGPTACLSDAAGGVPQNIQFVLSEPAELESLGDFLKQVGIHTIELADPARIPFQLVKLLVGAHVPYEIFLADAGLLDPSGMLPEPGDNTLAPILGENRQGEDRGSGFIDFELYRNRWRALAMKGDRILAPCQIAAAFAALHFPGLKISTLEQGEISTPQAKANPARSNGRLGIVVLRACAQELKSLRGLTAALAHVRPDLQIVVIGGSLDDRELMQRANVYVTGPVDRTDFNRVLVQYQIQSVLTGLGHPLFGHPIEQAAMRSGLPVAQFDWSNGHFHASKGNLTIPPALADRQIAKRLVDWMEGHS
jgi:GT2 family glycosyltransferase